MNKIKIKELAEMKDSELIQYIHDYLKGAGGAAQFHYILNDVCLCVEKDHPGDLFEVVLCKKTKENPFGVSHVPWNKPREDMVLVYNEINHE